jgi:hypothetical protein
MHWHTNFIIARSLQIPSNKIFRIILSPVNTVQHKLSRLKPKNINGPIEFVTT